MLTDLTVAAVFLTIVVFFGRKQQMIQCKYYTKASLAKLMFRQQHHLEECYGYLQH